MYNIVSLIINDNMELKFEVNGDLLELFDNEQEMLSYIDEDKLNETLVPFVSELLKRIGKVK